MKGSVFSFLLIILLFTACQDKQQSGLTGLWELQVIEAKDSLGNWQEADWMKNGSGLLHYDGDNTMSVHFWPDTSYTPNQKPYWYVAKYNTAGDTVFHKRLMHAIPAENHKIAKRLFKLRADSLFLSAPDYGFRLTWTKK